VARERRRHDSAWWSEADKENAEQAEGGSVMTAPGAPLRTVDKEYILRTLFLVLASSALRGLDIGNRDRIACRNAQLSLLRRFDGLDLNKQHFLHIRRQRSRTNFALELDIIRESMDILRFPQLLRRSGWKQLAEEKGHFQAVPAT